MSGSCFREMLRSHVKDAKHTNHDLKIWDWKIVKHLSWINAVPARLFDAQVSGYLTICGYQTRRDLAVHPSSISPSTSFIPDSSTSLTPSVAASPVHGLAILGNTLL